MAKSNKTRSAGKGTSGAGAPARDTSNGKSAATAKAAGTTAPSAKKGAHPRTVRQARMSQTFSQVVGVLMRDPQYKNLKLSDLQWLVLPPIMAGQWKIGQTAMPAGPQKEKDSSTLIPVAVALWASVSPAVAKRLSGNLDKPIDIKANEWAAGDIIWLMVVGGDPRAIPKFLKALIDTQFKGKQVNWRVRGADGKSVVKVLSHAAAR